MGQTGQRLDLGDWGTKPTPKQQKKQKVKIVVKIGVVY